MDASMAPGTSGMAELVASFGSLRVAVVGDLMLDRYLRGDAYRLAPEAPVPVVDIERCEEQAGGAANVAMNLVSLGAEVSLLGAVGADADGEVLLGCLETHGVGTEGVRRVAGRGTLSKQRVVAAGQSLVRFDLGSKAPLVDDEEARLRSALLEQVRTADAIVVADYGYGILTPSIVDALRGAGLVVVDAKDLALYREVAPTVVKPNYGQALHLLGESMPEGERAFHIAANGRRLLEASGARIVACTLDAEGAVILERDCEPYRTYVPPVDHPATAGAGDTYGAAFTLALAAGATAAEAAEVASAAATVVVRRDGTAACTTSELQAQLLGDEKWLRDAEAVRARIEALRASGRRVVFTNGCFDILHAGHVAYLSRAKALGDVLVVGVNDDASVARLKGEGRPINGIEDRLRMLSALSCVDYVTSFSEDTPARLLGEVRPQLYVKGGDYRLETLPETSLVAALGGEVRVLPYFEDRSTTRIIERAYRAHGLARRA